MNNLKEVEIDEIELCFKLLRDEIGPEVINGMKYQEIASLIEKEFNIKCSYRDIFLIYEPTIEDEVLDSFLHYKILSQ